MYASLEVPANANRDLRNSIRFNGQPLPECAELSIEHNHMGLTVVHVDRIPVDVHARVSTAFSVQVEETP